MGLIDDNRHFVRQALRRIAGGADPAAFLAPDAEWNGPHPFAPRQGPAAVAEVWAQLRRAIPDLEWRDEIAVSGLSRPDPRVPHFAEGRALVAVCGRYQGTFAADLLGVPATGGVVHLRACEVHQVDGGRILRSWVLWDFVDLMRQAGVWPLAPSLGAEGQWCAPATADGVAPGGGPARGDAAFDRVMRMHAALATFDGQSVHSMDMAPWWTTDFLWFGPAGIGTSRGLDGFRAVHQVPFLTGFPDRRGAGHYVRIAEGDYVVTGGWPSVTGTHLCEWLGLPPSGRRIEMRVMDFYRLEGDRIAENWVPMDIPHMLLQMGFDLFGRVGALRGRAPRDLPAGGAPAVTRPG